MKYKAVIGLEMHCELKSNSKVFSGARNSYSDLANSNVSAVDMAFPGTLPIVNKKCVKDAIKMAMVLNCEIPKYMYFDRKNYYYPDLPKGYQITQFTSPVGVNGHIDIEVNGQMVPIDIHDIHLEEDAASMDHLYDSSVIDYNRAGVPLLELVTEPCIHSADEAVAFLEHMRSAYQYCDVSLADTKMGQIRCDVNVSIMDPDSTELGTRVEIKNINKFSGVRDAILYEIKRQSELKDAGRYDEVEQETRRYDEDQNITIRMRSKADAIDYKYFVDPNLPKYKISDEWLQSIKDEIPMLRHERKKFYIDNYSLSDYDATILVRDKEVSDYFEAMVNNSIDPKVASNWITTILIGSMNKLNCSISELGITSKMLCGVLNLVDSDKISRSNAKKVLYKAIDDKRDPLEIIEEEGLSQVTDDSVLINFIHEAFNENPKVIEEYKSGKDYVVNFFVGQVMKKTRGQANPGKTLELIKEEIKKF